MDQLWHLEPIWSGTFTNLAINVLSGHFLGWGTPNKSGEHCVVYNSALHASDHELLAFSSHFARRFYFSPPKSATFLCEEIKITPFLGRGHNRFLVFLDYFLIGASMPPNKLHFTDTTFQAASVELFRMNFGVRWKKLPKPDFSVRCDKNSLVTLTSTFSIVYCTVQVESKIVRS